MIELVTWRGYGSGCVRQFSDIRLSWVGWGWALLGCLVLADAIADAPEKPAVTAPAIPVPAITAPAVTPEERAIAAILAAATAPPSELHPLPLAASWNRGEQSATGFGPLYQIEQIRRGEYLLPWFDLLAPPADALSAGSPGTDHYSRPADALYYKPGIEYLAQHGLPLSFESLQWESILYRLSADYADPNNHDRELPLTPFGPVAPWYAVGQAWARQPTLQVLQRLYPRPPRVLFISNNEQVKLSPAELNAPPQGTDPALVARRRAIGDAWIERYRALLQGFRDGLTPAWRDRALFIGYDAFVTPAMGRWGGWMQYSLYVPGRIEPWPYAWDGASPSFYVHDWAPDSDYTVWSPEIESMNWVAPLAQVRRARPSFWFELSTWDGQQPGQASDKRRFYAERGQQLTPERYGGMVQFGMWLLRPRVLREFRNPQDDRIRFGAYFDAILAAVRRVHENPTLAEFWEHGRLLANPTGGHPYEEALPAELATPPRWFLLDATANPPRPWQLSTPLEVFSLALERGTAHKREWLVYAFSPQNDSLETDVQIPGAGHYRVKALRGGSFTLVTEADGKSRPLEE